jgi:hypothetical protein
MNPELFAATGDDCIESNVLDEQERESLGSKRLSAGRREVVPFLSRLEAP